MLSYIYTRKQQVYLCVKYNNKSLIQQEHKENKTTAKLQTKKIFKVHLTHSEVRSI